MIDLPSDRSMIRPWVVCESGNRWLTAVRRFAPDLMPGQLVVEVTHADPGNTDSVLAGHRRAVVLWEVHRTNFTAACDWLATTAIRWPKTLRLAAGSGLSDRELIVLSEFCVATTLRHPEQLPRLASMIKAYFATSN